MDVDESTDVLMQDGDTSIIASTEPYGQIATEALVKPADEDSDNDATELRKPSETPLKGEGVKRAESDVFDYDLTKRQYAPHPPKYDSLPYSSSQTGLVYDVRMRFHVEAVPTDDDIHPEDPRRIHVIFESFVDAGLAFKEDVTPASNYLMGRIEARMVTEEEVRLVHTKDHYDWIQSVARMTDEDFEDAPQQHLGHKMDSIYLSRETPYCAALSAGGAIEACRAVMLGKVKNVFAVIRPPGHHAEREDAKGFCFFDNVSIATKVCQREFGEKCRKVFILDWDVHHGNGIQQANYDDPNVLYVSLHVHEKGRFYPECSYRDKRGPYGDHLHCGSGAGLGKNVNIPWSKKGMGDADYIYAFQQVIMPIAIEFDPDLVIIAAGFDAAEGDMLGGCNVTPAGYAHMTHMLMSLADGKVAVCLEGGYNLESIARSATAVGRTLMGEPPERLENTNPTMSGVDDIKLVLRQQSRFWSCLYPKDPSTRLAGPLHGQRMHNVVRKWQATTLWDEYEMTPLSVLRENLSQSFEDQVLATPHYMEARPLLVILHDPPQLIASPDPRTGVIDLHNTWLTDIVKTYVDWAVKQGFAVIDVNLPKHVSEPDDTQEHADSDDVDYRTREATQLLTYLWDNYIELNESTHVFLMGTNTGHGAIINFIKANEERVQELLIGAISFVEDVPLMSCKSATNDLLASWYYNSSRVFVTAEHNFWSTEVARKTRKRFGRVQKSSQETITDMLIEHKQEVFNLLAQKTEGWRESRTREDQDWIMDTTSAEHASTLKSRMPPIGNFAPSARARTHSPSHPSMNNNFTSPRAGFGPPIGSFTLSPRERQPRSPGR